jgi:hypothetical protein
VVWLAVRNGGTPQAVLVDEQVGRLRGVTFGDSSSAVRARLGEPSDDEDGFFPHGADYTGPPAIPAPASDRGSRTPPDELHYEDAAYLVSPTAGVFSMAILAEGARTRAGIGVGDELERVREVYDRVNCGEAIAGEPLFGDDYPTYPWCRAVVGDVRVFFGEDPIESVTLTRLADTRRGRRGRSSRRPRRRTRARARPRRSARAPGRT